MTKSAQIQIVSERPLRRGWERCFNYPDNLLSGGGTVATRWPYAQQSQLISRLYISSQVEQDVRRNEGGINADNRLIQEEGKRGEWTDGREEEKDDDDDNVQRIQGQEVVKKCKEGFPFPRVHLSAPCFPLTAHN